MHISDDALKTLPAIYSQEHEKDPMVHLKFFNPIGCQSWFLTEYDPEEKLAFGLVDLGFDGPELGYFSLEELGAIELDLGLQIEIDEFFEPKRLSEVKSELNCNIAIGG